MDLKRLATGCLVAGCLGAVTFGSAPSMALEDQAAFPGKFTWIIPDEISSQYPDGTLHGVSEHYLPEIRIARNAGGVFEVTLTLPSTLVAGQVVKSTYVHQGTTDREMLFVNPEVPGDYLKCTDADTWVRVRCFDVTFKGVAAVPKEEREEFAAALYRGTSAELGMSVVAGAEPGGKIEFIRIDENPRPFSRTWAITIAKNDGATATGTMRIDGFTGVYQLDGSDMVGLIRYVVYQDQTATFDWYYADKDGNAVLEVGRRSFAGDFYVSPEFNQEGTWTGEIR